MFLEDMRLWKVEIFSHGVCKEKWPFQKMMPHKTLGMTLQQVIPFYHSILRHSDSWSLNIIMTTVMNSVNFDNPHRNCVYILYTKVVRDVYNWCIQNVYKMYTTFRQTTHFVYKIERTMAAKFCMQNVYKSLLKCGIRFV